MDWRLAGGLGLTGLIPGALAVMGWLPASLELPLWLGLGFIWVTVVVRKAPKAPFQHAFMATLIAGFLAADLPAIFFGTFLANNPDALIAPVNGTEGQTLSRATMLLSGILFGVLYGTFTGAVALLAVRVTRPRHGAAIAPSIGAPMDISHPERQKTGMELLSDDSEE